MSQTHVLSEGRNLLLRALPAEDAALIEPSLERLELPRSYVLERPQMPIEHVYFPEKGIASTLAHAGRHRRSETAIFGREGASGTAVVLGNSRSAYECFMQVPGEGWRISADALREAMEASPTLRLSLLPFVQAFMLQTAHTALANAHGRLEEKLCRWLLMCHDRVDGDAIPMTHDFMATMLGVRRAGVTTALHSVEGRGVIRAMRGKIEVRDREGLEVCADDLYGAPEAEYHRLTGFDLRAARS